ncbi:MAG: ATP-binding cassette domain-containing protein [Candidatus Neomarinimicrobiota bacterium]
MTNSLSFSLQSKNSYNQVYHDHSFSSGLHIIYGESGVGKSDLINLISGKSHFWSEFFDIKNVNPKNGINIILQNPELQIISNTVENELAFSLECNSNNSNFITKQLNAATELLLFNADTDRHPVTLSGGEKELLNISTTFLLPGKVILIDDSLSFLSDQLKRTVVEQYFNIKKNDSVIIWFSSDESDLNYSSSKWILTNSELLRSDTHNSNELPKEKLRGGKINLEIDKLHFYYAAENPIFNNLSKQVNNFRCLGIIGNNGCGKSTLASLLLSLEKPISGSIKLIYKNNKNIEIGYLDQFPERLLGIMTLADFVDLLITNGKLDHAKLNQIKLDIQSINIAWESIKNILALDLSWTTLRIALIIILSNCNYDLLILDEPTFGMGTQQKLNLRTYFTRYLEEKHLLLISHDHNYIESICDSVIKL